MATYDSVHTGQQVDEAVDIVLANKNKGTSDTPIYLDANGAAINITKATSVTQNDSKLITSGAAFTGLSLKYNKADIVTDPNLGTSNVVIPSCGAVKTYVDNQVATKQVPVSAGDNINITNNVISVVPSDDMITMKELDNKWSHFGNLDVGENSDVLEKMDEAVHSTFDSSKFTVVGSPVITNDGIASGFSANDYVYIPLSYDIEHKTYTFKIKWNYKDNSTNQIPFSFGNSRLTYEYATHKLFCVQIKSDNTSANCAVITFPNALANGDIVDIEYTISQTSQTLIVYVNGVKYTNSSAYTLKAETITTFVIGKFVTYYPVTMGSIDLKQFSITVDGVEVFSGNKTGIDTIKPDDYTVVGTPTISADGILSGISAGNYVYKHMSLTLTNTKPHKFKFRVYLDPTETIQIIISTNLNFNCVIYYNNNDKRIYYSLKGGSYFLKSDLLSDYTWYDVVCEYDGISTMYVTTTNAETGVSSTMSLQNVGEFSNAITDLEFGYHYNIGTYNSGKIDLNSIRIYVDGDLVYQPCLKIPYTLTKDGKKIVDEVYRDRVEDEYTQAGFTPYYTLQAENKGNYLVVGTPTISSDFVASGFSYNGFSGNAINFPANTFRPSSKTWRIECSATTASSIQNGCIFGINYISSNDCGVLIKINGSGTVSFQVYSAINTSLLASDSVFVVQPNTTYNFALEFTGTKYNGYINENLVVTADSTTPVYQENSRDNIIGARINVDQHFNGSIDLKEFKVYVDGKLAYQAVIPPNYTMATVKSSDIIDSYDNGVTKWTKYADLTLKQTGSWTAGSAVTFDKKFRDTNYAITVPYTSGTKLATGFTPSAASGAGDWVAIGKTTLD